MNAAAEVVPCVGCGVVVEPADGPTHPYMLSSPGCWIAYGELLTHGPGQMAVDSFAVQHPGVDEARARQSVAVHLMSLCVTLERGWSAGRAMDLLRSAVENPPVAWPLIGADPPVGAVTVVDVLLSDDPVPVAVRAWATDVWDAYGDRHDLVRGWVDLVADR